MRWRSGRGCAEIVELTGVVARSGTIEALEGVVLDTALNLVHRLPAADRSMQLTAADVLADMPATARLFADGAVSWGQVRGIVAEAKRLSRADRAVLDGVDAAAPGDDGRPLSQRRADGLVALALQRCPDHAGGCGKGCGPGAESAGAKAPDIYKDADADSGGAVRMTRHRRLDRAVPAFTVAVDLRQASVNAAGVIAVNAPGCLPTLTARVVEALAGDASVRVVLFDGGRPLAVTKKVHARDLPADVRFAVTVRDGGDRFPGSRRPIRHVHHLDKHGVGHHPDHLIGLADVSHQRVHRHGWSIAIDPRTGAATFTRAERSWTTLPKGTRLRRPPPPDDS